MHAEPELATLQLVTALTATTILLGYIFRQLQLVHFVGFRVTVSV